VHAQGATLTQIYSTDVAQR